MGKRGHQIRFFHLLLEVFFASVNLHLQILCPPQKACLSICMLCGCFCGCVWHAGGSLITFILMVALSMVLLYYKRSVRAFLFTKQLQHRYTTFCAPTTAIAECVLATKFAECILATKKKSMFEFLYAMWVFLWACMVRRRIIDRVYSNGCSKLSSVVL